MKCLRIRKFGRKLLALLGGVGLNGGEKQGQGSRTTSSFDMADGLWGYAQLRLLHAEVEAAQKRSI